MGNKAAIRRAGAGKLTNRIAIVLGALLLLAALADAVLLDGAASVFLARKFIDLVDWTEFWR